MSMQRHHCMNLHIKRGRYRYQKQPIFHIKISKMPRKAFMRISDIDFLLNGTKSEFLVASNSGKSFSALRGRGHTPFPLAVVSPPLRKILDPALEVSAGLISSGECGGEPAPVPQPPTVHLHPCTHSRMENRQQSSCTCVLLEIFRVLH